MVGKRKYYYENDPSNTFCKEKCKHVDYNAKIGSKRCGDNLCGNHIEQGTDKKGCFIICKKLQ